MLISNYIQRQIGEYEALSHRASAVLDLIAEHPDADLHLMQEAGRILIGHHTARIRRVQNQIAYQLRNRPDALDSIDRYNETNIYRLLALPEDPAPTGGFIARALQRKHTPQEAEHVAFILLSIANRRAMTQIHAEIISRDHEDHLARAYQDVLFTLARDTEHAQIQRELTPMEPERLTSLGIAHLADTAEQDTQRSRAIANAKPTRDGVAIGDLTERAPQSATPAMPHCTQVEFPMRELTDPELAAIADGARSLTTYLRTIGMKALSSNDHLTARAAHRVAEQFTATFILNYEHRVLNEALDDPDERVLTPKRFQRAIQPALDLDQATQAMRERPLTQRDQIHAYETAVRAAALTGHAVALRWHLQRIYNPGPRRIHQPQENATASWIHEHTLRRMLEDQPSPPASLRAAWKRARRALHEFEGTNEFRGRNDDVIVETMRPVFHHQSVTSPLDHPHPNYWPFETQVALEREPHQLPQEWTASYQYQDAHYAKRIGEPYHHPIDSKTARQHAIDILAELQNGIHGCEPTYASHLEQIAIIAHEMAAAGLQSVSENDLCNAIQTAFRYIPRTTAIHQIIDDLAGQRPTAASHLKALYHPGSQLLTKEQATAIVNAAHASGMHQIALHEMCQRLQISPELQTQLGIPPTFRVNREHAELVVKLIQDLSPTAYQATHTAAREMGWTLTELNQGLHSADTDDD